ncbi:MAG: glycosyltransferase family 4 protein [Planctomycetota bacterium]|jgi:glycosyltransferase involved in cell wall biosynthesis
MKVLFFSAELAPYHLACLAALTERGRHEVVAAEAKIRQTHGYDAAARRRYGVPIVEDAPAWAACVDALARRDYDVAFVHGYSEPDCRRVADAARKAGVPVVVKIDNTAFDAKRPWWKELLKRLYLRRHADYVFVPGERAAEYVRGLGVPRSRIWRGLFGIDVDYYASGAAKARDAADDTRREYDLPERYFLHCGYLSDSKNTIRLVEGYRRYRGLVSGPWPLLMLGWGPHEDAIRRMDVPGVDLRGFVQLGDLPAYYGLASCFCIASVHDPWPLVLLEAVASGLPAIVSWKCGNSVELLREGWNGWLCDPHDPGDIARKMRGAHLDDEVTRNAREHGSGLATGYTPEAWAMKVESYLRRLDERE